MTRRFADFSKPAPPIWRFKDTVIVALASTIAVGAFVVLFGLFLLVRPAGAKWENSGRPDISRWYKTLMQPDNPLMSCCGESDAYWADKVETGPDGELIAVITDDRADEPLGRRHVPLGTRIVVPKNKIKFDQGNPTGRIIIFLSTTNAVFCYVQAGGV